MGGRGRKRKDPVRSTGFPFRVVHFVGRSPVAPQQPARHDARHHAPRLAQEPGDGQQGVELVRFAHDPSPLAASMANPETPATNTPERRDVRTNASRAGSAARSALSFRRRPVPAPPAAARVRSSRPRSRSRRRGNRRRRPERPLAAGGRGAAVRRPTSNSARSRRNAPRRFAAPAKRASPLPQEDEQHAGTCPSTTKPAGRPRHRPRSKVDDARAGRRRSGLGVDGAGHRRDGASRTPAPCPLSRDADGRGLRNSRLRP